MPEFGSITAETWAMTMLKRAAGSLAAAVVLAGVVPALANAAGANVPNPVGIALRASGDLLTGGEEECVEEKPGAQVTLPESASREHPASTTECPDEEASPSPSPSESTSPSPSPSPSESEEPEDEANHGQIVSTVAHCAPKGKDPLLEVEGAPSNHGGYVRVAAHGETLSTPWGEFDLSTMAGAEALCAALETARAELPEDADDKTKGKGKGNKDKKKNRGNPHNG